MKTINSKTSTKRLCERLNAGNASQELLYLLHKRMWRWILKQYELKRYIQPSDLKAEWANLYAPSSVENLRTHHFCFLCLNQVNHIEKNVYDPYHTIGSRSNTLCDTCPLGSCTHSNSLYLNLCESILKGDNYWAVKYAQRILTCLI